MSRLDLIAGPNGAGKSTYYRKEIHTRRPGLPFVNADVIAKARWEDDAEARSYDAARIAEQTRQALIDGRFDFAAETVFSHPSKVELIERATAADYEVFLHVLMIPLGLSAARVAKRVEQGGHSVPEEKLAPRYGRLWPLIAQAVPSCSVALFWDNSRPVGPNHVAAYRFGVLDDAPEWPDWTPPVLLAL